MLLSAVRRRLVRRMLLKAENPFDAMLESLKRAYTRAWMNGMTEAVAAALDRLRDLGGGNFTATDADAILKTLETHMGPTAMQAALNGPILKLTEPLWKLGAIEGAGMDVVFNLADMDALAVVERGNLFWVGQHWNSYTYERFNRILTDYFTTGLTREGLVQRFAEDFASFTEKGRTYWEIMADHAATKTREIGRVTGYEKAGVEYVEVRAHLDDRTTRICRHMHGRVISVKELRTQADAYLKAIENMNPAAAKKAWPLLGEKETDAYINGQSNKVLGGPPYHFRCRTITVTRFKEA